MAFWTISRGVTVTTLGVSIVHNLSCTPGSYVVRPLARGSTGTVPVGYLNAQTNSVDVCSAINTAVLCDVECQVIPPSSLISS